MPHERRNSRFPPALPATIFIDSLRKVYLRFPKAISWARPGVGALNLQQTAEQRREENREYLLGLWAEILATENVAADSDFFQLGGDSLQMMTMLFRISQDLGVE